MDRRRFTQALGVGILGTRSLLGRHSWRPFFQVPATDVRAMGAVGDGKTDDTRAIQRAIDALPPAGGSVRIPTGTYAIDAVTALRLRSHLTLQLDTGAVLQALPTGAGNYAVLRGNSLSDLHILGGRIKGERAGHLPPSTGEWGMGIDLRGCSDSTIDGVTVEECWGDGIYLGHSTPAGTPGGECSQVTVRNCVLRHNRRQGMSVTGCLGLVVEDCSFSGTVGTPPAAGIDLEPNAGKRVEDVSIRRSSFCSNAGWGLLVGSAGVLRMIVSENRFRGNGLGGVRLIRARSATVEGNIIDVTVGAAVSVEGEGADNAIGVNTITQNGRPVGDGRLFVQKSGATGVRWTTPPAP